MEIRQIEIFKVRNHQKKMHGENVKVNEKYYPQTLLEECKYEIKNIKMENFINDNLDPISSNSDSDNETDNELDNDESN